MDEKILNLKNIYLRICCEAKAGECKDGKCSIPDELCIAIGDVLREAESLYDLQAQLVSITSYKLP